ncbi:hypothetical protein GC167_03565 [bacterium]|nr:hypothetical protein [bacterium]
MNRLLRLSSLFVLLILMAACTAVDEQKCGPSIESMPVTAFKDSEFSVLNYDAGQGQVLLRYRSSKLTGMCTFAPSAFVLEAAGNFDIEEARVRWRENGLSNLALAQQGNRWTGESVPRYFDVDFGNGPASAWVEVDFRFAYTGPDDLGAIIDALEAQLIEFEILPQAYMHL